MRHGAEDPATARRLTRPSLLRRRPIVQRCPTGGEAVIFRPVVQGPMATALPRSRSHVPSPGRFGRTTARYVDRPQAPMEFRHRPGTAPGPADDRPSPLRAHAGDPTPITQVKVRTRAKSITGFSLSKPVPSFKTGYRFSSSRLTSLVFSLVDDCAGDFEQHFLFETATVCICFGIMLLFKSHVS